jgi:hypothetical protein
VERIVSRIRLPPPPLCFQIVARQFSELCPPGAQRARRCRSTWANPAPHGRAAFLPGPGRTEHSQAIQRPRSAYSADPRRGLGSAGGSSARCAMRDHGSSSTAARVWRARRWPARALRRLSRELPCVMAARDFDEPADV